VSEILGWARARPPYAYSLRRGAWYPVLQDTDSTEVVLDTSYRVVVIPKNSLQIRKHRPEHFSVVVRAPDEPNPVRGTTRDLGRMYAVCPASRSRVAIQGRPTHLECPDCGCQFPVAWEDVC